MQNPCRSHRAPAYVRTPADAVRTLRLATDDGRKDCAVVACVDASRRPLTLFVVEGPGPVDDGAEAVLEAVVRVGGTEESLCDAVFLGSSRPGRERGPTPADEERWLRMAEQCADAGFELLDWFLVADGAVCSVPEGLRPGPGW